MGDRKERHVYQTFSYWDFVSEMSNTPPNPEGMFASDPGSLTSASKSWDLGAGWEGAVEMGVTGYPKASKAIAQVRAATRQLLDLGAPSYEWDVTGMSPDIPEFLSGNPENMMGWSDEEARPVLRIGIAGCYHAGNNAKYATNMGGAVLTLLDAMEAAGSAVELVSCFRLSGGYDPRLTAACNVVVKSSEEYVDVDRMAYAICHPAFFRRLFFRWIELLDAKDQSILGWGYGTPNAISDDEADDWDILIPAPDRSTSGTKEVALETVIAAAGDLIEVEV